VATQSLPGGIEIKMNLSAGSKVINNYMSNNQNRQNNNNDDDLELDYDIENGSNFDTKKQRLIDNKEGQQ
jgi:hypothetical protein